MADILLNKQVNVWRGDQEPPTIYHVWISGSQTLKIHDGTQWQTFLDNPGLSVSTNTDGSIQVNNGETYFTLSVDGSALSIRRSGSDIVIKSTALNTIPTDAWLTWNGTTLLHNDANSEKGVETYGPKTDSNSSSFTVPSIIVDAKGHVVAGSSKGITVPDKVVQNPVSQTETNKYPVILAGSSSTEKETGEVNKDSNLSLEITYKGGETTKILKTPGIQADGGVIINGNVIVPEGYQIRGTVVGNVTGTATPTDHADRTAKYGVGTSAGEDGTDALYGHVKLQDSLPFEKPKAGYTEAGQGIAASPLMVWNAMEKVKIDINDEFSDDFKKGEDGKIYFNWID